jgi:3-isopropylmalate/(R)-2-methylmalate dehydratase large subunit
MSHAKTLFEKIWERHEVVAETPATPAVLYIDLHLTHEVTTPQAFAMLRQRHLKVRRPDKTFGTLDHSTPTIADELYGRSPMKLPQAAKQVSQFVDNCKEFNVPVLDIHHPERGIVHVIGPELGLTQPGQTIVCGDSHTSTHGAFGALAFGIGTTEVGHVLATQSLLQRKPKTMAIEIDGRLAPGATAKDLILAIIRQIGIGGGTGCVIEYRGEAIRAMSMDERMTICNMSIEAGARAGLIAPDATTFEYLKGREHAPQGAQWDKALSAWQSLFSDEGAHFDHTVRINAATIKPMITYGTNPEMSVAIDEPIPTKPNDAVFAQAMEYMGLTPGQSMQGLKIHQVFIGSCTNARLSDLKDAAEIFKDRQVAPGVVALVVPGSQAIKRQAEALGLDQIFIKAGVQWREAGCSMCLGMNGDTVPSGHYCVSTSNRNFEGRQGKGARTLLASPQMAAWAAIHGTLVDPRQPKAAH